MTDQLKRAISAAKTAQSNSEQAEAIGLASSSAGEQNFDMSESSYKTSHTAVRKARRFAMQGLYEWLVTDRRFDMTGKLGWKANAPHDIAARTRATNAMHTVHIGYYHEMMHDIPEQIEALNALISQHLDRDIDKLDTVEHAILLIGAYELQNRLEIPYKVVLDEAMKLNNHFGATDAHKLINAVLDRMAVELRAVEVEADTKANLRTSQKAVKAQETTLAVNNEVEDIGAEDKPTASTKPRISANNATVKRNRPNKAGTATNSVKEALAKNRMPAAEVSVEPAPTVNADSTLTTGTADINIKAEPIHADSAAVNNENTATENTVAEVTVSTDTDRIETLPKIASSDLENNVSNDNHADHVETVSVKTDSSEIESTETNVSDANDSDKNSSDKKSND